MTRREFRESGIKLLYILEIGGYFDKEEIDPEQIEKLARYKTITPGDFGRLSDTIMFMPQEDINGQYIINQLCDIQKEKLEFDGESRGIGFCA